MRIEVVHGDIMAQEGRQFSASALCPAAAVRYSIASTVIDESSGG
jgi:hypothetical protein